LPAIDLDDLAARLASWAAHQYGPDASIAELRAMPGNAGLSFGFSVIVDGATKDRLVMRMPPKGVRRRGNTDVIRQVPLLQTLRRVGVKVAPVRWWSEDEQWFEVPFFMVDLLPGHTFVMGNPDPSFDTSPGAVQQLYRLAVDEMVKVHQVDWRRELPEWEAPKNLREEITFWDEILPKAAEKQWIGWGEETRALLLDTIPTDPPIGIFHGDFQTNNILFTPAADGSGMELVALLDWEISGIGAHRMDIGWFLMMNDPQSWDPSANRGGPDLADLAARYEERCGVAVPDINWYRALSGYRFGVITCLNVMLHRTGKRPDPAWDVIAPSVYFLFGRARDLLRGAGDA
jgi:aminoglycoside phosphotransferase (APT) family kinase protein